MKAVVFGKGFLGKRIADYFGYDLPDINVLDLQALNHYLDKTNPEMIVNCVGKTGRPNIDWCENHPAETYLSNVAAPIALASAALSRGVYFVHLGSGCIYQGDNEGKGFTEEDTPNHSANLYARTKILAEQALKDFPALQLRIRMPIDNRPDPRNLIDKLLKYDEVIATSNSMTALPDFIEVFGRFISRKTTGIYNVVNPGVISPDQIMAMYQKIVDPNHQFKTISLKQLEERVKAPRSNCVLSTKKLQREDIHLRDIQEAVKACLKQYADRRTQQAWF